VTVGKDAVVAVTLLLAASFLGCGGPHARGSSPRTNTPSALGDGGSASADAGPGEDVPSLDAIAARGANEAPLMREVLRVSDASRPIELPPRDRDACYRVAVAASHPIRARIEDATKTPRGDATPSATSTFVPLRGPACAKKGEVLRLVVDAEPGTIARAVVWQAP
jgi:hypothetical protein